MSPVDQFQMSENTGHTHDPKKGYPGLFQAPITRNENFSTGQLSKF
jgi:hypothetical protein